jgi:hypothetical protein
MSDDCQFLNEALYTNFADLSWIPDNFAFTCGDETTLNGGMAGEALVSAEGSQRKFPCPAPISAKLG